MYPDVRSLQISVDDCSFAGPHGPLTVRTYQPPEGIPVTAGLVWAHGGAFAFGDIDMPEADWVARQLAQEGIAVVSIDYQLAPTPPGAEAWAPVKTEGVVFPVASEEVSAAFTWAAGSGRLGVPPESWSLGGASAGANLAAGASMRLRDEGQAGPRSLVLAYPLVHAELPAHRPELAVKVASLPQGNAFPPEVVAAVSLNYVKDPELLSSAYAFPGSQDLEGLPPTFILNSDHDALRSSGELFASELAAAGVDVLQIREEGTQHGHLNEPDNPAASRSIRRFVAWLAGGPLLGVPHEKSRPSDMSEENGLH